MSSVSRVAWLVSDRDGDYTIHLDRTPKPVVTAGVDYVKPPGFWDFCGFQMNKVFRGLRRLIPVGEVRRVRITIKVLD